jgi:RND family efflux transporter MFP subunit
MPHKLTVTAALCVALLAGCQKQPPAPLAAPRPVKIEIVGSASAQSDESFVGTLRARLRSDLSFDAPGRIAAIDVDVGDQVRAGQVLARLQEAPARWRVDKAQADRAAAAAAFAEREVQLLQQRALAADHVISEAAFESARAQHAQARSQLETADTALAAARRDLEYTRIVAPFDGTIVGRTAQPHADIGAGQPALQIEGGHALELVAMLPDPVAARIAPGQAATASVGATRLALKLERLSWRNESGSLVQALFRVEGNTAGLRSGGVVALQLPRHDAAGISLPAAAVMPAPERGRGTVFVVDPATQRLQRRAVGLGDAVLPDGRLAVTGGLANGDTVVVAGAAFLTEGEAVVRHDPQTMLSEAR